VNSLEITIDSHDALRILDLIRWRCLPDSRDASADIYEKISLQLKANGVNTGKILATGGK